MQTRYFAMIMGIIFLIAGLLGFVPGITSEPPAHAPAMVANGSYGYLLGLFPVNWLHNIVHLAIGVWGIVAYRGFLTARTFARGITVIYGVLAVAGLIPGLNTLWGLVPMFGHDIWLHAVSALAGAYFGWVRHDLPTATGRTATSAL